MDPESTTTIGDGESLAIEIPFQSMKAVDRTSAKFRTCAASCRGCIPERPSMVASWVVEGAVRVKCGAVKVSRSVGRAVCTPGDAGGSERVSRAVTLSARSEGARVLGSSRRGAWSQMSLDLLIGLRRSSQSQCCKRRERSTSTPNFYLLRMYRVLTTVMGY
jgi:hypothetical protein